MADGEPRREHWEEQLKAADPARNAPEPNLARMRADIASRPQSSTRASTLLHRRGTTTIFVGAAASLLLLGGTLASGILIGRSTIPTSNPLTTLPSAPTPPDTATTSPPMPTLGGTEQTRETAGASAALDIPIGKDMIYPGYGTTLIPAADLPNETGTAAGYRLVDTDVDREALAALLGTTFGVEGTPKEQEYGTWSVGADDGPSLWVGNDTMVSWSYWNPAIQTWDCRVVEPMQVDGDSGGSASGPDAAAPEECLPATPPPSSRDALKQARALLSGIGVTSDPAFDTGLEWDNNSDNWTTWVTAWQVVEGKRTQLSWSFSFTGDGLMSANGIAAGLEQVPAYPIVGARTAVLRSSDPKYAALGPNLLGGGVYPMAEASGGAGSAAAESSGAGTTGAQAQVPEGDPATVQVWWDPAVAVSAELTLVQYWQPDGTLLILPAYAITTADDRGTWAIIAVADSALNFIAP